MYLAGVGNAKKWRGRRWRPVVVRETVDEALTRVVEDLQRLQRDLEAWGCRRALAGPVKVGSHAYLP